MTLPVASRALVEGSREEQQQLGQLLPSCSSLMMSTICESAM